MVKIVPSQYLQLLLAVLLVIAGIAEGDAADLALIDAATLKSRPAGFVILDARPRSAWEGGHIPGAIPFFWEEYTHTDARGVKYSSLPPAELAAHLAGLGIDEKTPLVIYGDADTSWGGEGYAVWLFTWLGHQGVLRLLDGGIQGWKARNLPLVKGADKQPVAKVRYAVALEPRFTASTEMVQQLPRNAVLVDVRSTFEWIMGRIPGAIHISWDAFHAGPDRQPLPPAEVRRLLAEHGVTADKPVVFYCLGGVRSAYAWTIARLAGFTDVRNYRGGWAAWQKRSGR